MKNLIDFKFSNVGFIDQNNTILEKEICEKMAVKLINGLGENYNNLVDF